MTKTAKELAYLRDLYVEDDWTRRFTELVDKHIDLEDAENLLYINAGTGNHAIDLDDKFGDKTNIFARCEDEHMLAIARDKAIALRSEADFSSLDFADDSFDAVLADASFVPPGEITEFVQRAIQTARVGADVAVFLPSRGSFGEIFSLLWEVLFNEELGEQGALVEQMIAEIPSETELQAMGTRAGLVNVLTETVAAGLDYENGKAFLASPLVWDFLLSQWLQALDPGELERVTGAMDKLIEDEQGDAPFQFSIRATLLVGEKA